MKSRINVGNGTTIRAMIAMTNIAVAFFKILISDQSLFFFSRFKYPGHYFRDQLIQFGRDIGV